MYILICTSLIAPFILLSLYIYIFFKALLFPFAGVISIQEPWPGDEDDIYNLDQFSSTGPMCRYAQDLRLLTEVLAGDTIAKIDWYKKVHQTVAFL